jgi:hypothetical protein
VKTWCYQFSKRLGIRLEDEVALVEIINVDIEQGDRVAVAAVRRGDDGVVAILIHAVVATLVIYIIPIVDFRAVEIDLVDSDLEVGDDIITMLEVGSALAIVVESESVCTFSRDTGTATSRVSSSSP